MGQRSRDLIEMDLLMYINSGVPAFLEERLAACPEAAQYPDEVVEDFLMAGMYLDALDRKEMVKALKQAQIAFPPEFALDKYRLGRHVMRRWLDPAFRETFRRSVLTYLPYGPLARLKRSGDMQELQTFCRRVGSVPAFSLFRKVGMGDLIPKVLAAMTPEMAMLHQAGMLWSRLELHRFVTEPEPARVPSRWEQQKLLRRIHLRNVQLRSMGRNLHALRQEQKVLLDRLREWDCQDVPELNALARELAAIRAERAEAERRHAAALAEQARRCQEELDELRARAVAESQDYQAALAGPRPWATVTRRG